MASNVSNAALWTSKYAPQIYRSQACSSARSSTTNGSTPAPAPPPHLEFARFQHAVRRLKWKLPYLADSHSKATSYSENLREEVERERREVETMFKLDFFEYYTVLERALVHLLGVWGILPPKDVQIVNGSAPAAPGLWSSHTYHASLLTLLTAPTNPLAPILGRKEVYTHLVAAKQLRNRWKSAEEHGEEGNPEPLKAWEIEQMLMVIFAAFGEAEALALAEVERVAEQLIGGGGAAPNGVGEQALVEEVGYVDEMDVEMEYL